MLGTTWALQMPQFYAVQQEPRTQNDLTYWLIQTLHNFKLTAKWFTQQSKRQPAKQQWDQTDASGVAKNETKPKTASDDMSKEEWDDIERK
jgi:hypothetical protein